MEHTTEAVPLAKATTGCESHLTRQEDLRIDQHRTFGPRAWAGADGCRLVMKRKLLAMGCGSDSFPVLRQEEARGLPTFTL
jgi:hypothetical protein